VTVDAFVCSTLTLKELIWTPSASYLVIWIETTPFQNYTITMRNPALSVHAGFGLQNVGGGLSFIILPLPSTRLALVDGSSGAKNCVYSGTSLIFRVFCREGWPWSVGTDDAQFAEDGTGGCVPSYGPGRCSTTIITALTLVKTLSHEHFPVSWGGSRLWYWSWMIAKTKKAHRKKRTRSHT